MMVKAEVRAQGTVLMGFEKLSTTVQPSAVCSTGVLLVTALPEKLATSLPAVSLSRRAESEN